ncbi:MAG: ATP-binding protein [Desulforhopalus sp.]|nr:ATP-binding protein [Desulforhopalus sp.]
MIGKGPKTGIMLTFALMLVLAMCLQSVIFIFLGVRSAVREDVSLASFTLQALSRFATYHGGGNDEERQRLMASYEDLHDEKTEGFSCLRVELKENVATGLFPCLFPEELSEKAKQARTSGKPAIGFAGSSWNVFLQRSEVAQIAVPLLSRTGQVVGTISAERSLLPIYARYEQDVLIAFFYLIVNTAIICGLGYFRMERILFRPLDKLVEKADNYCSDQQSLFLISDEENAFRKLSTSLNVLLDRIESDNRKLRQTVSELEGVNKDLKDKNDLVVRSEKLASVGRLSAGLAHEIGNPLSIIQGYVGLLSRDDLSSEEKKQYSDKAYQELDRIKKLIRQLLDFAGPIRSASGPLSVNGVIDEVIGFIKLEKSFSGCSIITRLHAEQDQIVADTDALRQVLINCFLNSVDAMAELPYVSREIVVETFNAPTGTMATALIVTIQDNGAGIDEAHLQDIFDPFFTTKEVGRGTGLGLFVCHTIMERLGGKISLSNVEPSGVAVKLELPLQDEASYDATERV